MKLTPWFPGSVKPVRKGVYQQMDGHGENVGYQHWNGAVWGLWGPDPLLATIRAEYAAGIFAQNDPWRGLSEKPK